MSYHRGAAGLDYQQVVGCWQLREECQARRKHIRKLSWKLCPNGIYSKRSSVGLGMKSQREHAADIGKENSEW